MRKGTVRCNNIQERLDSDSGVDHHEDFRRDKLAQARGRANRQRIL